MKIYITAFFSEEKESFGCFEYDAPRKTKLEDIEKYISKFVGGETFRRITLVEDFMRAVFSSEYTIPLRICPEANMIQLLKYYDCIRLNYLFERGTVTFQIDKIGCSTELDKDKIKDIFYSLGHYLGVNALPCEIPYQSVNDFLNKKNSLIDVADVPESLKIKVTHKMKSFKSTFEKTTNFADFVNGIFEKLGMKNENLYRIVKGSIKNCLLILEFPGYSIQKGFSTMILGEVCKIFKNEFIIHVDDEKIKVKVKNK